jgi:hypothetical protein
MKTAVVSRVWKGEIPYIEAWIHYYLHKLVFDKIYLIRCDEERFDFIPKQENIIFLDHPAKTEEEVFNAITTFKIPTDIDYIFSCDIDEFLVLHDLTVQEFILKNQADSYFFPWFLCCNIENAASNLSENIKQGCSFGHQSKTMFRTSNCLNILTEHEVAMSQDSHHVRFTGKNLAQEPYLIHFTSRNKEDLVYRGFHQNIKIESDRNKYFENLISPPDKFIDLAFRYKIAFFQKSLNKICLPDNLIDLPVKINEIYSLFEEQQLEILWMSNLFKKKYSIKHIINLYPNVDFYELNKKNGIWKQLKLK